jgi:hypothetical protein
MKKNLRQILNYVAGLLFAIVSIMDFIDGDISMGIVYIGLAITFISLGFNYMKKGN